MDRPSTFICVAHEFTERSGLNGDLRAHNGGDRSPLSRESTGN